MHPHTTVRQAAELINDFQVEGVPVVAAGGALLGLVTPTELVRLLANPPDDSVRHCQLGTRCHWAAGVFHLRRQAALLRRPPAVGH